QATAAAIMSQFANNLKRQLAQHLSEGDVTAAETGVSEQVRAQSIASPAFDQSTAKSDGAPSMAAPGPQPDLPAADTKPISGFSLIMQVLWKAVLRAVTGRVTT